MWSSEPGGANAFVPASSQIALRGTAMTGVENLHRLNDKLTRGLSLARHARAGLRTLPPSEVDRELEQVLAFVRRDVLPRARAEERVFYPEVARVLGVDLGERMLTEHHDINRLVRALTDHQTTVSTTGAVPDALYRDLSALVDLITAHVRLEGEAIQAMVDRGFRDADANALYEQMEIAAFDEETAAASR